MHILNSGNVTTDGVCLGLNNTAQGTVRGGQRHVDGEQTLVVNIPAVNQTERNDVDADLRVVNLGKCAADKVVALGIGGLHDVGIAHSSTGSSRLCSNAFHASTAHFTLTGYAETPCRASS